MITTNKLKDPNLSEEEQDAIIGAFVRQRENQALRKRWVTKLSNEHGVSVPKKQQASSAVIRKITFAVLAIAASLLLVFALLPALSGPSGEELLASYLDETNIQTSRGGIADNTADSLRTVFSTAFFREDYAAAITVGQQLTANPSAVANDTFNLGLSYLKAGDNSSAISSFKALLSTSSDLETEASFYLAVALLQDGKSTEALELLNTIKESDGLTIFNKAQDLINLNWEEN